MFIQLIFILFGLIQTEFIQQEFSLLPESLACADYRSEDCEVFYVTTNIENIKVGDYVLAQDVETGEVSLKEVTDTFVRTSDHIRYLTTIDEEGDEQVIETTDSHPVWVVTDSPDLSKAAQDVVVENGTTLIHENLAVTEHGYYVEAKDLRIGDVFIGANGELTTLTGTEWVEYPDSITVYNFTVADNHNYFIIGSLEAYENGASVVLVHNADYHGNSRQSLVPTTLYGRFDENGHFLKWGISQNPDTRYTKKQMAGGHLEEYMTGSRSEILDWEKYLVERHPGPMNREPWAGKRTH
jgi:hypothetical protein